MGGVDCFDQLCSTYSFKRKQNKWYKTIMYFLIDRALANAFICYNWGKSKKITQQAFRNRVIQGLLEKTMSSKVLWDLRIKLNRLIIDQAKDILWQCLKTRKKRIVWYAAFCQKNADSRKNGIARENKHRISAKTALINPQCSLCHVLKRIIRVLKKFTKKKCKCWEKCKLLFYKRN